MDLEALRDFNLVVSHGGFSEASRITGKPKATLSRHVRKLEESLGIRLLERVGKTFRVTEEGRVLQLRTEGLLNDIAEVANELTSGRGQPHGKLRVSSPVTFGNNVMGTIAAEFVQAYPNIQLEVTIEDRIVDLIEESYDVVIRVNPSPNAELVGRCFYRDHLLLVAPPTLPRPTADNPTPVPAIVSVQAAELDTWIYEENNEQHSVIRQAALRLPSPLMVRDAVLANTGVAILANNLVANDIAAGRIVSWGRIPNGSVDIWVLHTSRRLVSARVNAFVQFLCQAFKDSNTTSLAQKNIHTRNVK